MNDELADRDLVEVLGGRGSNVPLIQEAAKRSGALRPALPAQAGGHVHWCSGLLYAFWCDACKVSAFFRHCC